VVIGSQARAERVTDAFSDLDLVIVTAEPRYFLEKDGWLNALGVPIVTFREPRATGGGLERRAVFEPGLDIDFIPIALEEWAAFIAGQGPADVLRPFALGYLVIFDREGNLEASSNALCQGVSASPLPDESTLRELCGNYLCHGRWAAKKLGRGELFTAKACLDCHMKRSLLTLIQWHARLSPVNDVQIWSRGRFLEQWAQPCIQESLRASFAAYTRPI
jgi:aminoglycoside 6-adenylyltransferase